MSVRLLDALQLGLGFNVLADARTRVIDRGAGDGAIDVNLPFRGAPTLGLLYSPSPRWALGARFTAGLSMDYTLDVVSARGVQDAALSLRGVAYYTPLELVVGGRLAPRPGVRVFADFVYRRWSDAVPSASDVALVLRDAGGITGVSGAFAPAVFRDIVAPRVALEWDFPLGREVLTLRAGYAFLASPLPRSSASDGFVDCDRHQFAAGASATLGSLLGILFTAHASLTWLHLVPTALPPASVLRPPSIASGDTIGGTAVLSAQF